MRRASVAREPAVGRLPRTAKEVKSTMLTLPEARDLLAALRREEGQTMAEYGVVLAVITLLVIAAFIALAGGINGAIEAVTAVLPG